MNFTKAAEVLNITQPAVSQHIHFLEENYQVKLFEFMGKKLKLTKAGEILLSTVTTMKHDDIHLRNIISDIQKTEHCLIFGATLSIGSFVLPPKIANYLLKHPDAVIHMVVANTKELLQKIDQGEIDFALVEGFYAKKEYDSLVYSKEKYIAVCGREYPLMHTPITIEDLMGEMLILRELGSGTREILNKYLEIRNLSLTDFKRKIEISNIDAIKTLAKLNCGITFLYKATVKDELDSGVLKEIKLNDFPILHDFTFIWRKNSVFAQYYHELFHLLREG